MLPSLAPNNRRVYGQWQNNLPSRFINELPPANIEICNNSNYYAENNYSYGSYTRNNTGKQNSYYNNHSHGYRTANSKSIGTRVHHESFGDGTVVAADGNSFQVCFDNGTIKKLMGSYLTKI